METQEGMIPESTTSMESTEGDTSVNTDATASQEQQETEEITTQGEGTASSDAVSEEAATPFLTIRHNHEDKPLTQDEATVLAQKGMAYDAMYSQIARAAAIQGKDVKEFIAGFEKAADEAKRQELMAQYGDAAIVDQMMELYQYKKEQTVSAAEKARKQAEETETQSVNQRLADEFIELKKAFPDLQSFESLPDSVKKAAGAGMSLEHAYLKFQHTEAKKVAEAQKAAETAANKSTGSMGTDDTSQETLADQRYRAALWS